MKVRWAIVCLWGAVLIGCYRDFTIAPRGGTDAGGRTTDGGFREPPGACIASSDVDLLFVIDDSPSMIETQAHLARALPGFIEMLMDPIVDLRVGVITTDMGVGSHTLPSCSELGEDGRLRTTSAGETCTGPYPQFLQFASDSPSSTVNDLSCLLQAGGDGCGVEQPLEAWLKALSPQTPTSYTSPSYVPPTFLSGEGHGDRAHAGFIRDDTLLSVIIVTDEDDCSILDPELFNPESTRYGGTGLNLRCSTFPRALFSEDRYIDGLLALRARRPDLVTFSVIAGLPGDLATETPNAADFQAMLEDPRMQERLDPENPERLFASCSRREGRLAFPPRRLVRVAAGLGVGRATVQSICEPSFESVMAPIARLIARRACAERAPR